MDQTFEEYMAEEGAELYAEVLDWLAEAPECVNTRHLLGKSREEYAMSVCQSDYHG